MTKYLVCYAVVFLSMLVIDAIWLGVVVKDFYKSQIGHLMADQVNFVAAGLFYFVYPMGLVYFASAVGLDSGEWKDTAVRGLIFGFVAYCTYDLSNLATLRGFPAQFAAVDIVWGSCVSAVAATAGMVVAKQFA